MKMLAPFARRICARLMDNPDFRAALAEGARGIGRIDVDKFVHSDPSDPRSPLVHVGRAEGKNLFVNVGINRIWDLVTGASSATYTNGEAQIGIGDSSTAAAAGQTDLQAASNKTWKAMDATYPQSGSSQQCVFRSTFATGDANYAWAEFAVRRSTGTLLLNRGVSAMGTKTSAGTWVATVTLSIS